MLIYKSDVYNVKMNQRGVYYLREMFSHRVIAKKCTKCNTFKFLNDYNKAQKGFAGTHSLCRSCHKKNNVDYRKMLKVDAEIRALYNQKVNTLHQVFLEEEKAREHAYAVKRSLVISLG